MRWLCLFLLFGSVCNAHAQSSPEAFQQGTVDNPLRGVPAEGRVIAVSGVPTAIYGQRAPDCGAAPSWEYAMEKISLKPKNGILSDGGVGVRRSRSCGPTTNTRVVVYTSTSDYIGQDEVEFGGHDKVKIEINPRN